VTRASELSQFAYCRRAWWLSTVLGYPSSNVAEMDAGARTHAKHGRGISSAISTRRVAWALMILGIVLLTAYILRGA
jgi:CRISPR/Cas system-associated exonuclease Cas4 (RecB family)